MGEFGGSRPPTCLLCNSYFDRKPAIISPGAHGGQDHQIEEFKRAFKLFCKLSKVLISRGSERLLRDRSNFIVEDEDNKCEGLGDHFRMGHPCCGSCSTGLLDLLRLEKIIEESKARQQEVLEALKGVIVDNQDSHKAQLEKVWAPVRAEVIQGLNSTMNALPIYEVASSANDFLDDDHDDPLQDSFETGFVLPDVEQPDPLSLEKEMHMSPQSLDEEPFESDPLWEPEPPPAKRSRRKQTFSEKVIQITEKDEPPATPWKTPILISSPHFLRPPSKIKPCSIPLTRVKVEDHEMTVVNSKVKKRGRGRPRKEKFLDCAPSKISVLSRGRKIPRNVKLQLGIKKLVRRPHGKGEGVHFRNVFYMLADHILLFQNTPVSFKPDRFKCLELGCTYYVPGSDYFSFENMRAHINECHGDEYDRMTDCRPCPICREEFADGKSIRNHFITNHTPHKVGTRCTVICESCWKPMPYYCLAYHVWFHKSEEEKQTALDSGEPISTKLKVMLGLVEKKGKSGKKRSKKSVNSSSDEEEQEWANNKSGLNSDPEFIPESSCNSREGILASNGDSEIALQPKSEVIPEMLEIIKSKERKKDKKLRKKFQRKEVTRKITRSKHGQGPGVNFKSVFYLITDEILLCQNTPIRLEPTGFTCLEPECSHFVPGSDYLTFQNMKAHINECHGLAYERKKMLRSCPLCPEKCTDGKTFRKHIVTEHTPSPVPTRCTVVCESCWKPMPYYCYLHHTWFHKSEEEKKHAIEGGERISTKVKISLGIVDKNRPHNMPNKFRDGDFFFNLGANYFYHKGIIIQFSAEEFICREGGCNTRIKGSDYETFAKFRRHVETCHNLALKMEPELESEIEEQEEEADSTSRRICPVCDLQFVGMNAFKRHIFWDHSPVAVCTSCWKPIKSYLGMGKHVWLHMNEDERAAAESDPQLDKDFYPIQRKTYYCQSCPMQFHNTTNLRAHEKTHIPKHLRPKYKCDLCDFEGLYRISLRAHIESKHKPELAKKKLECRICGRQFGHRYGHKLRIHMRSHTGETPFVCEVCGKGFISQQTLRTHSNSVHITTRPFQCEYCEKSYKLDYVLRLHQRKVHKDLVPPANPKFQKCGVNIKYREMVGPKIAFPCDHCGKVFRFKSRLKYHVKTSHPEIDMIS